MVYPKAYIMKIESILFVSNFYVLKSNKCHLAKMSAYKCSQLKTKQRYIYTYIVSLQQSNSNYSMKLKYKRKIQ